MRAADGPVREDYCGGRRGWILEAERFICACHLSVPVCQRFSISASERLSVPVCQRFSVPVSQRVSVSVSQRVSVSASARPSVPACFRVVDGVFVAVITVVFLREAKEIANMKQPSN